MQPVNLPSNGIVYGSVKSEVVFKELRAVSFNASFNEFVIMVLPRLFTSDGHLR